MQIFKTTCVQMSGQCPTEVNLSSPGGISWNEETSCPMVRRPESNFLRFGVRRISRPELSTTLPWRPGLS